MIRHHCSADDWVDLFPWHKKTAFIGGFFIVV